MARLRAAYKSRPKIGWVLSLAVVATTAGIVTGVAVVITNARLHNLPGTAVFQKAAFSVFYPAPHVTGLGLDATSLTYDTSNDALVYTVFVHGQKVVISEQATPDMFSQNNVYSYKLGQAHEYSSFNSAAGEVALTKPDGLNGQTLAWVNAKGTLTLAHALSNLAIDDWKLLFNNLLVVH